MQWKCWSEQQCMPAVLCGRTYQIHVMMSCISKLDIDQGLQVLVTLVLYWKNWVVMTSVLQGRCYRMWSDTVEHSKLSVPMQDERSRLGNLLVHTLIYLRRLPLCPVEHSNIVCICATSSSAVQLTLTHVHIYNSLHLLLDMHPHSRTHQLGRGQWYKLLCCRVIYIPKTVIPLLYALIYIASYWHEHRWTSTHMES